jgi:hypothetical protein
MKFIQFLRYKLYTPCGQIQHVSAGVESNIDKNSSIVRQQVE